MNKYHIKGERKEADWSVAKNLLKPKDGGKVKVIEKTKCSFILEQKSHTAITKVHISAYQPYTSMGTGGYAMSYVKQITTR